MHWTKNYVAAAIAGSLGTLVPISALNAEPVIIKYEGPSRDSYKPGKRLLPNAKISLKTGEVLTVLDERGTRVLRGPGTFDSSSSANIKSVSNTSLTALIKTSSVRRARTGAVRGDGSAPRMANPNLWFVDVSKSGRVCVADFDNLQLWSNHTGSLREITTTDTATGKSASTQLGKGRMIANWPSSVPPANGGNYKFGISGQAEKTAIQLVKVAMTGEERLDNMASTLLENGCQIQSELLAATFAQASPTPTGGQ